MYDADAYDARVIYGIGAKTHGKRYYLFYEVLIV